MVQAGNDSGLDYSSGSGGREKISLCEEKLDRTDKTCSYILFEDRVQGSIKKDSGFSKTLNTYVGAGLMD